jgi:hypothetical protein
MALHVAGNIGRIFTDLSGYDSVYLGAIGIVATLTFWEMAG